MSSECSRAVAWYINSNDEARTAFRKSVGIYQEQEMMNLLAKLCIIFSFVLGFALGYFH